VEVAANAVAICGEDQCGKIRNGSGGREDGEGLDYLVTGQVKMMDGQPIDRLVTPPKEYDL